MILEMKPAVDAVTSMMTLGLTYKRMHQNPKWQLWMIPFPNLYLNSAYENLVQLSIISIDNLNKLCMKRKLTNLRMGSYKHKTEPKNLV